MKVDSASRSAWHRMRRRGRARVAAQLAAPVTLGLLIGGTLAYQAGSSNNAVHPVPLGAVPTPTPSWVKPSAVHGAVEPATGHWINSPAPAATASAVPTPTPVATASASGR